MSDKMIVYCGLDCAQCEAYQATQANDPAWQQRLLDAWRIEYKSPDMPLSAVTCDGCSATSGRLGGYCAACPIRACALEHNLATCADCPEYACEKLEGFLTQAPPARANLEALRAAKH